jgi:shikimate dehydrogenase
MRIFGLIGLSLAHSFSRQYFIQKFRSEGLDDCSYLNFELDSITRFPGLLETNKDLCGLNVTIPYKQQVIPYLDTCSDVVNAMGACNCIKISGGKTTGYNTDVAGFKQSFIPGLKSWHKKALVLGSGGASKAVTYALDDLGISYRIVSRHAGENNFTYSELDEKVLEEYKLLINTTPLGTFPKVDELPPIPYHLITKQHYLFDLVYNPAKTKFLEEGEKRGAQVCNGERMLEIQAEESWKIWNGL